MRPSMGGAVALGSVRALYEQSLATDETKIEKRAPRKSFESFTGLKSQGAGRFTQSMKADNAKRGAAQRSSNEDGDLHALLSLAEASDPSLPTLNLSANREFTWLSAPRRVEVFERVSSGNALTQLLLDAMGLDVGIVAPLAAAIRNHTRLERLSAERNGLNEAALMTLASACSAHPALTYVAVSQQCNQELLTQPALITLIDAMEATPTMTTLKLGKIVDPTQRMRLDAVTMANLDRQRQLRVASGAKDARRAAGKGVDWAVEARNVAGGWPHEYGAPSDAADDTERRQTYTVHGNPLWRAATEAERRAVLAAFTTNATITTLSLVNAVVKDEAAEQLAEALKTNSTLTTVNAESNHIASAGFEALAGAIEVNTTVTELKLANQGLAMSQASEAILAAAVDANSTLLRLTVEYAAQSIHPATTTTTCCRHLLCRAGRMLCPHHLSSLSVHAASATTTHASGYSGGSAAIRTPSGSSAGGPPQRHQHSAAGPARQPCAGQRSSRPTGAVRRHSSPRTHRSSWGARMARRSCRTRTWSRAMRCGAAPRRPRRVRCSAPSARTPSCAPSC